MLSTTLRATFLVILFATATLAQRDDNGRTLSRKILRWNGNVYR